MVSRSPVGASGRYWAPFYGARPLSERMGRWAFWLTFLGFNVAFLPMHLTGLMGMPRRIYTYPAGLGWDTLNLITTIGSFVFALGLLLFLVNVWWSRRHGAVAGRTHGTRPRSSGRFRRRHRRTTSR